MSLYNKIFGENEDAAALLGMLHLTRNKFGRYRDAYLNKEGTVITVVTRIGGGNKHDYNQVYTDMKRHPHYLKDYPDEFDETYQYFDFNVPAGYQWTCSKIAPKEDRKSVGEMFKQEVEDAKDPNSAASKRMEQLAHEIFGDLFDDGDGPDDGTIHIIHL